MKRNISLICLVFEIAAIVVLHAVKMSQAQPQGHDLTANMLKSSVSNHTGKHYQQLLSLK